ncbi:MAG: GNAT family N-acetyltransferase [Candidatus Promineifilaceae bacterium]
MNQAEFPKDHPIIKTKRLILRGISLDDSTAIFRNFSDPDIAKWFFEQPHTQMEQTTQFIDQFISEFEQGKGLTWAITLKANSRCIGTCGYGDIEIGNKGEIGFDLAKEYWGKGLMSEGLIAIIDYSFADLLLSRVEAHTYYNNDRAKNLLEKLGFQLKKNLDDSCYYFLSKANWSNLSP